MPDDQAERNRTPASSALRQTKRHSRRLCPSLVKQSAKCGGSTRSAAIRIRAPRNDISVNVQEKNLGRAPTSQPDALIGTRGSARAFRPFILFPVPCRMHTQNAVQWFQGTAPLRASTLMAEDARVRKRKRPRVTAAPCSSLWAAPPEKTELNGTRKIDQSFLANGPGGRIHPPVFRHYEARFCIGGSSRFWRSTCAAISRHRVAIQPYSFAIALPASS